MLGTGLSASSLSESTIPSRISSSSTVGTYCRQIGSSGDLISSTIAGEIRNSKFSAAWRRRSRSGKCPGPNLAASASSDLIELVLRTSCQVSMTLPVLLPESANQRLRVTASLARKARLERLRVDDLIVARGIEVGDPGHGAIAPRLVEAAGRRVLRPAGGLHDDQSGDAGQAGFHGLEQGGADPAAVQQGVHRHPVEIVGAQRAGRGAPADPAGQAAVVLGAEGQVVGGAGHRPVEYLEGDRDLVRAEEADRTADLLDAAPVGRGEVPEGRQGEGAAHAADTPLTRAAAALWLWERMSASSTICMTRSS